MRNILMFISASDRSSVNFLRFSIFLVMVWIGGLKAFQYEADGIVPFVANSPFMSFFYSSSGRTVTIDGKKVPEYSVYRNPEGKTVKKNIEWHRGNGTYVFSYVLGAAIILIGICVLLGIWSPLMGLLGGTLTFLMSIVTISFLITTPEVYVPDLGGDFPTPRHGFPYLSGAGRLVLKDVVMMAGALVILSDSAKRLLKEQVDKEKR